MQLIRYHGRVEADGKEEVIFKGVGCANGTGWSPDGKTMCK